MNPEVKESEYVDTTAPGFSMSSDAPLVKTTSAPDPTTEQLKQIWSRIYLFLAGLPEYLSEFFGEYKRPLAVLGIIFGSIVSVKLTLALLDAINDIPLLAPSFELIGFAYSAWFIVRYLRTASGRQELGAKLDSLKSEVVGKN